MTLSVPICCGNGMWLVSLPSLFNGHGCYWECAICKRKVHRFPEGDVRRAEVEALLCRRLPS